MTHILHISLTQIILHQKSNKSDPPISLAMSTGAIKYNLRNKSGGWMNQQQKLYLLLAAKSLSQKRRDKVPLLSLSGTSSKSSVSTMTAPVRSKMPLSMAMSMSTNCGPACPRKESSYASRCQRKQAMRWSKEERPHLWSGIVKRANAFNSQVAKANNVC